MNILAIPFHEHLGLELASAPGLLQLAPRPEHMNHLGTVHASVLIALAEASSGLLLQQQLSDGTEQMGITVLPVIRRIDAKFHQAANGLLTTFHTMDLAELATVRISLASKGRAKVLVPIQVRNVGKETLLSVGFEWFIRRQQL